MRIRPARVEEIKELGDLCLRSKAFWGYDAAFLEACRRELTFRAGELTTTAIAVAEEGNGIAGVVQILVQIGVQIGAVDTVGAVADLLKLFVEPEKQGLGAGRALFTWAADAARTAGAHRLMIDADPGAAPFYRRMGARDVGFAPSGSIPGRMLPKLEFDLAGVRRP